VIDAPNGERSPAVYKKCGSRREFVNYVWNKSRNYRAPKRAQIG